MNVVTRLREYAGRYVKYRFWEGLWGGTKYKMERQMPKEIMTAIGLECCDAQVDQSGILCIGLGVKVVYTDPRLQGKFHCDWDFLAISSAWRVVKDKKIIIESISYSRYSASLSILVGERLISIVQPTPLDVTLSFSNNIEVNLLGQLSIDGSLEVLSPDGISFVIDEGVWSKSDSTESLRG